MDDWHGKHYAFFQNRECECFPCHEVAHPEDFNCLFCYCPLYMLGRDCGGNCSYTPDGFKDCTACLYPHRADSYGEILLRYGEIAARMAADEAAKRDD